MTTERVLELLATERECVSREGCDRECCSHCDLAQEQNEILEMYDTAISMLKAQEPLEPIEYNPKIYEYRYVCRGCHFMLLRIYHYCPNCGRELKWND